MVDLSQFIVRPSAEVGETFICKEMPEETMVMDAKGVMRTFPDYRAHVLEQRDARSTLTPGSLKLLGTLGAYEVISVRGRL